MTRLRHQANDYSYKQLMPLMTLCSLCRRVCEQLMIGSAINAAPKEPYKRLGRL